MMGKKKQTETAVPVADDWSLPDTSSSVLVFAGGNKDLRQQAWNEAMDERPATDATEPNSDEQLVINFFSAEHIKLREAAKDRYRTLHERFNKATRAPDTAGMDSSIGQARTNVRKDIAEHRNALNDARRNKERAGQSRDDFKAANNLKREARYPESKLYHFAIILLIVIIECIANMYYFAQGNELGLLGGIFQAALISVANVGSAIVIGYFVARAATHVNPSIKVPALIGIVLYAFGIGAFNLLAGHYRDLMSVPGQALEEAIPRMMADPFGLSFHSVLLFVTGLIAAVLAVYKGMTVDDAYLGYGDVDRDFKAAAADFEEISKRVQAQVVGRMDHLRAESQALRDAVATKRETMENCIDELGNLQSKYVGRVRKIEAECCLQLKTYRQYNMDIRVSPCPAYFDVYPEFKDADDDLALPSVTDWKNEMRSAETELKGVEQFAYAKDAEHEGLVNWAIAEFQRAADGEPPESMGSPVGGDSGPGGGSDDEKPLRILKMNE